MVIRTARSVGSAYKAKKGDKGNVRESLFFGKTVPAAIKMPSTFITSGIKLIAIINIELMR